MSRSRPLHPAVPLPCWLALLAFLLVPAGGVGAAPPRPPAAPLTRVADIFDLPRDTDDLSVPVTLEGVVTVTGLEGGSFFIDDGERGIHVVQPRGEPLTPGDRVRVEGDTRRGRYAPSVVPRRVTRLGRGEFPAARPASFSQVVSGALDSRWIAIDGVVSGASAAADGRELTLDVAQPDGRVRVVVVPPLPAHPDELLDCEVHICGVATGRFNQRGQMVRPIVLVPGRRWVTVTKNSPAAPFDLPVRTVSRLVDFSPDGRPQHRIHVEGIVTRQISDRLVFIRNDGRGLKVETREPISVTPGSRLAIVGFPTVGNDEVMVENAICRQLGETAAPPAFVVDAKTLSDGTHASDLVTLSARVVDTVADGATLTVILESGHRLFRAMLRRGPGAPGPAPEKGSLVAATGICVWGEHDLLQMASPASFGLLLANRDDLRVIQRPTWWTPQRLVWALLLSLSLLAAGGGWVWSLRRQVQRTRSVIELQAAHAAVLEERSRIARELHDTLEQGLTGLSLQFKAIETELNRTPHPVATRLTFAREILRQSRALARNAIRELRAETSPALTHGLVAALTSTTKMWNQSGALVVALRVTGTAQRLPAACEHHLFSIATEAITNAIKHGRAAALKVELTFAPDRVALEIADNGEGFDPATLTSLSHGRFGVVGMRERACEIGAAFEIHSGVGAGTTIRVQLPLSRMAAGEPSQPSTHTTAVAGAVEAEQVV